MANVLCLRHSQLQTSLRELCFCSRSAQWAGVATGAARLGGWAADAGRRLRHEMLILELLYRCVCPHARDQYLQALHFCPWECSLRTRNPESIPAMRILC